MDLLDRVCVFRQKHQPQELCEIVFLPFPFRTADLYGGRPDYPFQYRMDQGKAVELEKKHNIHNYDIWKEQQPNRLPPKKKRLQSPYLQRIMNETSYSQK